MLSYGPFTQDVFLHLNRTEKVVLPWHDRPQPNTRMWQTITHPSCVNEPHVTEPAVPFFTNPCFLHAACFILVNSWFIHNLKMLKLLIDVVEYVTSTVISARHTFVNVIFVPQTLNADDCLNDFRRELFWNEDNL